MPSILEIPQHLPQVPVVLKKKLDWSKLASLVSTSLYFQLDICAVCSHATVKARNAILRVYSFFFSLHLFVAMSGHDFEGDSKVFPPQERLSCLSFFLSFSD